MKDLNMILQEELARVMNPIIYKVDIDNGFIYETRNYSYGLKTRDRTPVSIPAIRPGRISETHYVGVNVFRTLEEAKCSIMGRSRELMQFHMNRFVIARDKLEKVLNGEFVIK